MIEPHDLPDDVIGIILQYYHEFQVADMADRLRRFRTEYGSVWSHVTDAITGMMQTYRILIRTYNDTRFSIPLDLPLCDFAGFAIIAKRNTWTITATRTVLRPASLQHCA